MNHLKYIDQKLTAFGVLVTKGVGTMWCAILFGILACVSLPQAIAGGTATLIQWIAQTFLQLVLLSIIMVGQSAQNEKHDKVLEHHESHSDKLSDILTILSGHPSLNKTRITSLEGGEIILPNPIRERFDDGKVTSVKDIL